MIQVPGTAFVHRVVESEDSATFTSVDPYGHLNTNRYLEMFVNHRVSAPDEKASVSTVAIAKEQRIGFVFHRIEMDFLSPVMVGEKVRMASWIESLSKAGFRVHGLMIGANSRVRCAFVAELKSVSLESGRLIPLPESVPCRDLAVETLPNKSEYLTGLKGVPASFLTQI